MIQLNSELNGIFSSLGELIPSSSINKFLGEEGVLDISIKTPNFFYKEYKVYIGEEDISNEIDPKNLDIIKSIISQAYFNYFTHYNEQFNKKYYCVTYSQDGDVLTPSKIVGKDTLV